MDPNSVDRLHLADGSLSGQIGRLAAVSDPCAPTPVIRFVSVVVPAADVDGTAIVEAAHGNVGASRAEGMQAMLSEAAGLERGEIWLSTTDADGVVPRHWLARQVSYAHRGAEAVAGTVEVNDWRQQPASTRRSFLAHQHRVGTGVGHGHVHGANLGLSAAAYLTSGGIPPLALAEDHALWVSLQARGQRLVSAPDLAVVTSARREGRTSGGFSSFLRSL